MSDHRAEKCIKQVGHANAVAKAGIYCAIGAGLRRCDEVDDTTAYTEIDEMRALLRATYGRGSELDPATRVSADRLAIFLDTRLKA
jgi:hypothetical protein